MGSLMVMSLQGDDHHHPVVFTVRTGTGNKANTTGIFADFTVLSKVFQVMKLTAFSTIHLSCTIAV
jgi:hypothetical protein